MNTSLSSKQGRPASSFRAFASIFRTRRHALPLLLAGSVAAFNMVGCRNATAADQGAVPASQKAIRIGPADALFWDAVPTEVPTGARHGDILQIQERHDAPAGARGYNIIYVSEGADGKPAYVSGMIFYPKGGKPDAQRRVMLWNHETSGSGDACAPSRNGVKLSWIDQRVHGLAEYSARGYVVVASDYPGLGTPDATVYMQGLPQAKASLDIVLAAQRLPEAHAGKRVAMAGWSQGGQTSLWASHIAPAYAPSLDIVGAVLLAPAARTLELVQYEAAHPRYGAYYMAILAGMQTGHPELHLKDVINEDGLELLPHLAYDCWSLWDTVKAKQPAVAKLNGMAPGTAWRAALEANEAFLPIPATIPILVYQGTADVDVTLDMTRRLVEDLCTTGSRVDNRELRGGSHRSAFTDTVAQVGAWVDDRFSSAPAASTCGN